MLVYFRLNRSESDYRINPNRNPISLNFIADRLQTNINLGFGLQFSRFVRFGLCGLSRGLVNIIMNQL